MQYILYHYGRTNVNIFFNGPESTYQLPGQRRIIGSKEVFFEKHIKVTGRQTQILSNYKNKLRIVDFLIARLREENVRVYQAETQCDRLISMAAVSAAKECSSKNVVVVGEELELLVLLIYHAESSNIFMLRPGKKATKISHVSVIQNELG